MMIGIAVTVVWLPVPSAGATAGQIIKLVTPEGGSVYYVGRCFRTDIKVQTDNLSANSVDVIIPYDPTYLAPYTGSGCTVAASAINTSGLFPSYPSNIITGNMIQVTGYDPSGTAPVNTGVAPNDRVLGHVFWKVLSPVASYPLTFDFTPGSTIDTNMAESGGDGTDALDGIEYLTLNLSTDASAPTFTNRSPAPGATNVSVTSGVSYTFNDAGAGVNSGSLTTKINGVSRSLSISGCAVTNSNRIPSCNAAVTGLGTLMYLTTYRVSATGSDLASPTPNSASTMWDFITEDDTDAPYITNRVPADGAIGVAVGTNIVFHVKDYKGNAGIIPGLGVDISTVQVSVTPAGGSTIVYTSASPQFNFSGTSVDYTVTINPSSDFDENKVITVVLNASDLHTPSPNVMSPVTYSFTTGDTSAPTFDSFVPLQDATDVPADTAVSFHILDGAGGAGVDIANTSVTIAGTTYISTDPEFSYSGTPADYAITIDPTANFSGNQTVTVSVLTRDLASTPNTASVSYSFRIASTCSTCFVDGESPARFVTTAPLTDTISFHVKDTGDGILQNSITVVLIGTGSALSGSPLTLTAASPMVSITGSPADYLVTITLPAPLESNVPVSVTIDATNINGLVMPSVGYTIASISGGSGTTVITVQSVCPAVAVQPSRGGNRDISAILDTLQPDEMQDIVEDRRLPDGTEVYRLLGRGDLLTCSPLHAAPEERSTQYIDIVPGSWYESAVRALLDAGALDAGKTLFRGDESAIRAEFATMLAKLGKLPLLSPTVPTFDDALPDSWYSPFIEAVAGKHIMKGYGDCAGTHPCQVLPAAIISRAEAAAMLVRYYGIQFEELAPRFSDVPADAWYAQIVQSAADRCIMQGQSEQTSVRPDEPINRAELAVMLHRASRHLRYGVDCSWGAPPVSDELSRATSSSAQETVVSSPAFSAARSSAHSWSTPEPVGLLTDVPTKTLFSSASSAPSVSPHETAQSDTSVSNIDLTVSSSSSASSISSSAFMSAPSASTIGASLLRFSKPASSSSTGVIPSVAPSYQAVPDGRRSLLMASVTFACILGISLILLIIRDVRRSRAQVKLPPGPKQDGGLSR